MEERLAELEQAFADYRQELAKCESERKPIDGLFGLGHAVKDDPCHARFDERIAQVVEAIRTAEPSETETAEALEILLAREDMQTWPSSAQWMLRAVERHALPLIPFLSPERADAFARKYAARYKPWDRFPAQKQVLLALKQKA